jgi:hypothetical protein
MTKSVCFVLMPFGVKPDSSGRFIDFDIVYKTIFKPAIEQAGLLPIRADEEQSHGFIHKLMVNACCSQNTPSPISQRSTPTSIMNSASAMRRGPRRRL